MRPTTTIIGDSSILAYALAEVSRLAGINRPVLIVGGRGTGKELAAERLHFLSNRWDAPFLKVNCASIAESLLESELFGHEAGAFTGATRQQKGRFERADGGTLFLDELATMSMRLQEKLLRLVEYGEFERVGGQQTLQVDVRVLAATNADLPRMAGNNEFRADLLDRLSFDVVHMPALAQRKEDIPALADHFALQMCAELGWELFPGFAPPALDTLLQHSWPGNIRELKNAVERSLFRWHSPGEPVADIVIDPFQTPFEQTQELPQGPSQELQGQTPLPTTPQPEEEPASFQQQLHNLEKQLLQRALASNGNNQRLTAEQLGLSYDQLRGMVRKHRLSTRKRRN
jgi:psp operon transcriptional activator